MQEEKASTTLPEQEQENRFLSYWHGNFSARTDSGGNLNGD